MFPFLKFSLTEIIKLIYFTIKLSKKNSYIKFINDFFKNLPIKKYIIHIIKNIILIYNNINTIFN